MKRWLYLIGIAVLALMISACAADTDDSSKSEDEAEEVAVLEEEEAENTSSEEIIVDIKSTEDEKIGEAIITETTDGVKLDVEAENLPPGSHGFHIHETGLCEAPDFESAGGHFNPGEEQHGFENAEGPHAGDIANLEVDEDGKVAASFENDMVTLKQGEANSLLKEGGTSLVIHSDPDDFVSQPAGDAGDRIACGVITAE